MRSSAPTIDFESEASTPVIKGTLGKGLEAVRVAVPVDVRIVEGRLEWIPCNTNGQWWPDGGIATRALDAFIKLAEKQGDERIADFVRRYGVLGLTESALPGCGSNHPFGGPTQPTEAWQGCAVSWEPLAAYRHYAAGAKAMLCLATALKRAQGKTIVNPRTLFSGVGLPVDALGCWDRARTICRVWQEMSERSWEEWAESSIGQAAIMNLVEIDPASIVHNFTYSTDLYGPLKDPAEFARTLREKFGYWLTTFWLKRAGLVPTVTWRADRPELGLSVGSSREGQFEYWPSNSMFRVLAAHLAARVCGGSNMATCSNCGDVFFPSRRPRMDQNHYCDVCKPTAPSRRTQKWRERKRALEIPC